ncbi:MAG: hypothetical protein ACE3JQ_01010 [Paenisporosarcina sp.]
MTKTIVDKAKSILVGLEIGFDTAKKWSEENYDDYYLYFSNPDYDLRKHSLLIFCVGLGNWESESAFIFLPHDDIDKEKEYIFEDYVRAFLDNREAIKLEFPFLYKAIVHFLKVLDTKNQFVTISRATDTTLFKELNELLQTTTRGYNFEAVLKEVNFPNESELPPYK